MGLRGYVFIKIEGGMDSTQSMELIRKIGNMKEVVLVDDVAGNYDMVALIDAPVTIKSVVEKISALPGVSSAQYCQVIKTSEF